MPDSEWYLPSTVTSNVAGRYRRSVLNTAATCSTPSGVTAGRTPGTRRPPRPRPDVGFTTTTTGAVMRSSGRYPVGDTDAFGLGEPDPLGFGEPLGLPDGWPEALGLGEPV